MEKSLYRQITRRNLGVYSRKEQEKIVGGVVAIIGVGCVGGMAAYILARMGIGRLVLVDFDVNELSNLNRQAMATYTTLGIPKVYAAKTIIKDVNPTIEVRAINERIDEDNAEKILSEADVVLQCTDSIIARIITVRACKKLRIPCIIMTGQPPYKSIVSTIMPDGPNYEELFGIDFVRGRKFIDTPQLAEKVRNLKYERAEHAARFQASKEWLERYTKGEVGWGITPERAYMTSVYQVHEALALITGRTPKAVAPKAYVSDLNGLGEFGKPDSLVAVMEPPNGRNWDYRWF